MQALLKEIDSLQEKITTLRPLTTNAIQQLREYYKVGLTYTSNALEGNSLTETETKVVIEDGLTVGGKPLHDHFEAIGHSNAYDFMFTLLNKKGFFEEDIKTLHYLFYHRIDQESAGNYRQKKVFISGSKYPCPGPGQVSDLMKKFVKNLEQLATDNHPVIYASLVHKEFVFIHPFIDGNGRVARLLMNVILLQNNYCLAIIPPVLRVNYLQTLEKAHTNDADFKTFIAQCIQETQKDYLRLLV